MGNSHPLISPYSVYKSFDDKWIVIGVATDDQFVKFRNVLGLKDPTGKYTSNSDRLDHREELDDAINAHLKKSGLPLDDLTVVLTKEGIPFSTINSIESLFANPTIKEIEDHIISNHPSANYDRNLKFVKNPISFSKMETAQPKDSPLLGQHTDSVLSSICGYSPDYISELREKEVI